ncbi:MAG TPA: AI-2E family transporter, partial [Bacilli bacterium]
MSFKTVFIMVLGLAFLYALFTIGSPFLLAIVLAIFLEPVNLLLIRYARMNRLAAATTTCTVFILVVGGLGYLIGLKIISEIISFSKKFPSYMSEFNDFFQSASIKTKLFYEKLPDDTALQMQKGVDSAIESLNGIILGISGTFLDLAKTIPSMFIYFIVFIVAFYLFSFSLNTIKVSFLSLFEEKSKDKVENVLVNLRKAIFGFLRAQMIISALTYLVVLIGCFILG